MMDRPVLLLPAALRPSRAAGVLFLVAAAGCCGGGEPAVEEPEPQKETPYRMDAEPVYQGHPLVAELEVMESEPPQYAVAVKTTVPSGGHTLEVDRVEREGGITRVLVSLTEPGEGEMVTTAFEDLEARAFLGYEADPVLHVLVATMVRGAAEDPPPPHRLAAVLRLPR